MTRRVVENMNFQMRDYIAKRRRMERQRNAAAFAAYCLTVWIVVIWALL